MRFKDIRDNSWWELCSENVKYKTVTIQSAEGKVKDISSATFRRWFRNIEESNS